MNVNILLKRFSSCYVPSFETVSNHYCTEKNIAFSTFSMGFSSGLYQQQNIVISVCDWNCWNVDITGADGMGISLLVMECGY